MCVCGSVSRSICRYEQIFNPLLACFASQLFSLDLEEIYIRNAALYAGDGIINLRRSGPAYVAITLMIPLTLCVC